MSPTKNKKQLNVLKINFDLENDKLVVEVNEEVDSTTAEKYNFIGFNRC